MTHHLLMPKLGLTMTEGSITKWNATPGDPVREGQVLLVIETDKVSYDVESETVGVLLEILVPEGETVPVGTVLARVGLPETAGQPAGAESPASAEPALAQSSNGSPAQSSSAPHVLIAEPASRGNRVVATPLARKRAAAAGVSLAEVAGSGPRGRVKAIDVETAAPSTASALAKAPIAGSAIVSRRRPSATQAAMARRLSESKHAVPHFYLASEAEVSTLELQRTALHRNHRHPRVTLTAFLVAAVARALTDIPQANTVWVEGELVTYGLADVGIAVHAPQGLLVPILRDAGAKPIDVIARESHALVERARNGELAVEDMAGGAMTVSNAGINNVTYMTPIIAPGQSAILGVGSIRKVFRPDSDGQPALRQELGLVLAADHRVFDGVSALQVLNCIIAYLESPARLVSG